MINNKFYSLILVCLSLSVPGALYASAAISTTMHTVENIDEQLAIAAAFNRVERKHGEIVVHNRQHFARFDRNGVMFKPEHGPQWQWQSMQQATSNVQYAVVPGYQPGKVEYVRGEIIERYLLKQNTIEQRFILEKPLQGNKDLILEGYIKSNGVFEVTQHGWQWRDEAGVVNLGRVTVFDAQGRKLKAHMTVTPTTSHIRVAATELVDAVYPVTVDPEIGSNDFRLSDMGPNGLTTYSAGGSALAYNSANNEFFVVWNGSDNTGSLVSGENEIFGQRVDAATGNEIGGDIRLSDMGPDGDVAYDAISPAVAYNSTNNEYLVVWRSDDNTGALIDGELEIFGQRVDAATGNEIGVDLRLSDMGPDGDTAYAAGSPAVAYNNTNNEYLVVWYGDDDTVPLVDQEHEIFGQRIDAATGNEIGVDTRLSDMGPDGNTAYAASFSTPSVAYNSINNEYLVVWGGDDDTAPQVDNEVEIYAQRLDAATGNEVGSNDFRISTTGIDGSILYYPSDPDIAYDSNNNEYLVVWRSDDGAAPLVDNEIEIFGQRIDAATGNEIGGDIRLSDMGPDGDAAYDAFSPAVNYNSANNEYLVVWHSDDNTGALIDQEIEIFGQRVDAITGSEIGGDIRLSDMGPDGSTLYFARDPAIAYSNKNNEYLVTWRGDDNTAPLVDNENEVFGQYFAGAATFRFTSTVLTVSETAGTVLVEVQRVGDTTNDVTVDYASSNGTAVAPADYTTVAGTLTFNAGEISKIFSVSVFEDNTSSLDKTINLTLSNAVAISGEAVLDVTMATSILTVANDGFPPLPASDSGAVSAWTLLLFAVPAWFSYRRRIV